MRRGRLRREARHPCRTAIRESVLKKRSACGAGSGAWTPQAQEQSEIGCSHFAVTVEIGVATLAGTPVADQKAQVRAVDHPVAVDPDDTLRAHAEAQGWPVVSLR